MMRSAKSLGPGAALVFGGFLLCAPFQKSIAQEDAAYHAVPIMAIYGTCTMEIAPDKALIIGGVSSSALKPSDAVEQLDKQLALMRAYVAEKHGELEMMERVRTVKNPQPGREASEPPFQVVQRLQATFPADAPVDAILEKLIELGMDRFGENVLNDYNRRQAVVRYHISDFDAKMTEFQQRCTGEAWKQWCATANSAKACAKPTPPPNLELQGFFVRSKESLMHPEGNSAPWQWSAGRGQQHPAPPPDLLGNVTVHLEGNINLTYQSEDEKP
jgi:Protein of unknown function (DUF541)